MASGGRHLVVGADGLIGQALVAHLDSLGEDVLETTRRGDTPTKRRLFLDLERDVSTWLPPLGISHAYLCAAITSTEDCRRKPSETMRVNVEASEIIARKLVASGAFVVLLSSNQVFDGSRPFCKAEEPLCPVTEYGRQKAELEQRLSSCGESLAIVRLTKIIPPEFRLFQTWLKALDAGDSVTPYLDKFFAPLPLSFSIETIAEVARRRLAGITQISGNRDITYEQAARHIVRQLGRRQFLVKPTPEPRSGERVSETPSYTTLDTTRLREELKRLPPDVWSTINAAVGL